VPGPGSYNVEKDTISFKNIEKLTSGMFSSMFQKPINDNLNSPLKVNPKNADLPGPGVYDLPSAFKLDKKPVGSSMFKSDSVRDLAAAKRGPGPAFYK
jgi:hypothetical protein